MVELAGLHLMQGNDDGLEEDDMLFSKGDGKSTDNAGEDIKELGCSIEFVCFVNQCVETIVDGLSDHCSPWNELSIKPVEDVLEILSLSGFFGIEQL